MATALTLIVNKVTTLVYDDVVTTDQREFFELKVLVDYDTAPSLTMGQEKIEDILVLHLEGGKDFFVSLVKFK